MFIIFVTVKLMVKYMKHILRKRSKQKKYTRKLRNLAILQHMSVPGKFLVGLKDI
jgi:hypothetical protein